MEPSTPAKDTANSQLFGVMTFMMAPVATFMVCAAIANRWGAYSWWDKVLAITLVLSLVIIPVGVIGKEKTWARRVETVGSSNVFLAYMWLVLAMRLFNRL